MAEVTHGADLTGILAATGRIHGETALLGAGGRHDEDAAQLQNLVDGAEPTPARWSQPDLSEG